MTDNSFEIAAGIAIIVDPVRGLKGKPMMVTDRNKKTVILFNNSDEYAVFTDKMLELGVTFDDLTLRKP